MDVRDRPHVEQVLMIQLARLGDVVQSLPAYVGVRARHPDARVDLLCASPLVSLAALFPSLDRALGWDGARWREWGRQWTDDAHAVMQRAAGYLHELRASPYDVAYNLNQHVRAILAGHLLAGRVVGPGAQGAVVSTLPPWAAYLREVARQRGANRVHLADAFCGLCGVRPPVAPPRVNAAGIDLPLGLSAIGETGGPWVALVVGAGDSERAIPPLVWSQWIARFLESSSTGQVVLIGAGAERQVARTIQDQLSSLDQGRVWDTTGRMSLPQLTSCLGRCGWVVGADTGPLHLGAAAGARALGWYISRARVHETGPYGPGHWVWQLADVHRGTFNVTRPVDDRDKKLTRDLCEEWPLQESVELILTGGCGSGPEGWSLWHSAFDAWGTAYISSDAGAEGRAREDVWRALESTQPREAAA